MLSRTDAGAGDLFASGFLYGLLRNYSLQKCCQMGCLAGGAIVQTLGAEMTAANWKWLFDRCARSNNVLTGSFYHLRALGSGT